MSLPLLFFFSYCLTLVLYIISLESVSKILFKQNGPFYILFPLLMIWPTNGIEQNALIHSNNFESLFLAIPITIFALAYLLEDKITASFILAAIATVIHLQIGVNIFIILFLCYLILNIRNPKRFNNILIPLLYYLIISAYPLSIAFRAISVNQAVARNHFFIDFVRFRAPHHFILSSISGHIKNFALLCFLGLISFISKQKECTDKKSVIFVSVIIVGVIIQYIFIELIPVDFFAKLQFFRMTVFVSMLSFMYISNFLYIALDKKRSLLVLIAVIMIIFSRNALLALVLFVLLHIAKDDKGRPAGKYVWLCFIFAVLIVLAHTLPFNSTEHYFKKLIFSILVGTLFYILMEKSRFRLYKMYHIPLLIFTVFIFPFQIRHGLFYNISMHNFPRNDWETVCFWIKKNTPSDALFITPPYRDGFHLYAERRELVDFKSSPLLEKDILEWQERLEDVLRIRDIFTIKEKGFKSQGIMRERYNSLCENEIKILARKYKAEYIVFEKPKKLPFEILYEDAQYIVYKLSAG
jgi:hypothetical protein